MTLKELQIGKMAVINTVGGDGALRQHFLDMGIIPGVEVTVVKFAPMGDPMEIRIHGYELTIRVADAEKIEITPIMKMKKNRDDRSIAKKTPHPGLGETGKFHHKDDGEPLPRGTKLTFALVGNQNCGKTT
ncbi:MAG: ferrous iron transport protein A, partial [Clostridia bacterium]|nr:ferrous iron transport protein A [Clostridia bacterium]